MLEGMRTCIGTCGIERIDNGTSKLLTTRAAEQPTLIMMASTDSR